MSQETQNPGPKRKLKRPIEEIRAELMQDEDTARIAKAVGLELPAYIEKVLEYLQYPDKKPVYNVVDDNEARAAGFPVRTDEELRQLLTDAANGEFEPGAQFRKSGFDSAPSGGARKPTVGAVPVASATSLSGPEDEARRKELQDQVKKGGGGNRF